MRTKYAALAALAVALAAVFLLPDLDRYLTLEAVKARQAELLALYAREPLPVLGAYFCIYVLTAALSLPGAAVLTLLGGALFGFWTALAAVSFASSLGAALAFLAARTLLRDLVRRRLGPRLAPVDRGVERDGALYLFTLRLIPAVPFFVVNLAMGLTPMRLSTFYWVSQLGMLPVTAAYVLAGRELGAIRSPADVLGPGPLAALVFLGLAPWGARLLARRLRPGNDGPRS